MTTVRNTKTKPLGGNKSATEEQTVTTVATTTSPAGVTREVATTIARSTETPGSQGTF